MKLTKYAKYITLKFHIPAKVKVSGCGILSTITVIIMASIASINVSKRLDSKKSPQYFVYIILLLYYVVGYCKNYS